MKHSIKMKKAQSVSGLGAKTFEAIYSKLPASVIGKINASEIAEICKIMYAQKELGANEMFDEMNNYKPLGRRLNTVGLSKI